MAVESNLSNEERVKRPLTELEFGKGSTSRDKFIYAMLEVALEYFTAISKFPPMKSPHEGAAIIQEEWDELWEEIKKQQTADKMREEAKQVAAMAIRFMVDCT